MQEQILNLLRKRPLSPSTIANRLNISRQALHRHLKVLLRNGRIKKEGLVPHIVYSLSRGSSESRVQETYVFFRETILPKYLKKNPFEKMYKKFCSKNKNLGAHDFSFMLDSAAVYSSNIEGNSLNFNSFLNSRLQPKKVRPKEAQEIEDLVGAYTFSQAHTLSEKNMLRAHALLSKEFLSKTRQGIYRKEPVGVFSSRGLEYLAIESELINTEMATLFEAISMLIKEKLTPLETFFWASWIHLMMALIHPFSDGNGRISRLCEKWFLVEKLGKILTFLPSEEHYFKNRPMYYSALKLGVNYWETDFKKSGVFIKLLPKALKP